MDARRFDAWKGAGDGTLAAEGAQGARREPGSALGRSSGGRTSRWRDDRRERAVYRFRTQVAVVLIVLTMMVAVPVPMNAAPPQGPDGHECALTTAHCSNAGGG